MSLTLPEQQASDALRNLGYGDRRIAEALDISYHHVRTDRETRQPGSASEDYRHVVILSDTQYPWIHEPSEQAVMEYVARTQPDELISVGDFMDFYSLASYRKGTPPSSRTYLLEEVEMGRAKLREWADLAPNARRRLVIGNHEDRLVRYLEDNGGELLDLFGDDLSLESLLRTRDSGWEVIGPYGAGCWVGEPGGLWVTHGELARKWSGFSAKANVMEKYGHSVVTGHTHRLGAFFHTRQPAYGPETIAGFEVGCLCDPSLTPRASAVVDWQYGFGVAWVSKTSPRFHVDLVAITDGGFVLGGVKYGR